MHCILAMQRPSTHQPTPTPDTRFPRRSAFLCDQAPPPPFIPTVKPADWDHAPARARPSIHRCSCRIGDFMTSAALLIHTPSFIRLPTGRIGKGHTVSTMGKKKHTGYQVRGVRIRPGSGEAHLLGRSNEHANLTRPGSFEFGTTPSEQMKTLNRLSDTGELESTVGVSLHTLLHNSHL